MPTYEYQCEKCGVFEVVQKMSDEALKTCAKCGSPVTRLLAAPAFHLKGSGWYKTDYAASSSSTTSANTSNSSPAKAETSKETASAPSSTTSESVGSTTTTSPKCSSSCGCDK